MSVAVAGDAIYFSGRIQLWFSDGTVAGTHLVLDGSGQLGIQSIGEVVALGNRGFLTAELETGELAVGH